MFDLGRAQTEAELPQTRGRAGDTVGDGTRVAFVLVVTLKSYFNPGSPHSHIRDPRESSVWAELVSCHLLSRNGFPWGCVYPPVKGTALLCVSTFAAGPKCC